MDFIRSVFVLSSPENAATGEKIVKMLERISTSEWEPTAAKILETLAASNISFPQPFSITEIIAAGQPKPSDRLYVDDKGFCANVVIEDDVYESLEVPYDTISDIYLSFQSTDTQRPPHLVVSVHSGAVPLIGTKPMSQIESAEEYIVEFSIERDKFPIFRQAVISRGLGNRIQTQMHRKQSIADKPAVLEVDSDGKLLGKDERYENLSQFYGTNDPSDEKSSTPDEDPIVTNAVQVTSSPQPKLNHTTPRENRVSDSSDQPSDSQVISARVARCRSDSKSLRRPTRTFSQQLRDAAFGTSDEELSELEWTQDPKQIEKTLANEAKPNSKTKPTKSTKATTKVILDSDDDVIEPKRPPRAKPARKLAVRKSTMLSDDEIENSSPLAAKNATLARRAQTAVTSITPPIRPASISFPKVQTMEQSVRTAQAKLAVTKSSNTPNVSPMPSDLPNAPATPIQPAVSVAKKELRKRPAKPIPQAKAALQKPRSDSPAPVSSPAAPPHSVKARLRKKDGTPAEPLKAKPPPVLKRKRNDKTEKENEQQEMHPDSDQPPAKKLKTLAANDEDLTPRSTDTLTLRPPQKASARPPKRYKGKKRRGSFSSDLPSHLIDYDAIPDNPSTTMVEDTPSPKPIPKSKKPMSVKPKKANKKLTKQTEDQLQSLDDLDIVPVPAAPPIKPKTRSKKPVQQVTKPVVAEVLPVLNDVAKESRVEDVKPSPEPERKQPARQVRTKSTTRINVMAKAKPARESSASLNPFTEDEPKAIEEQFDFGTSIDLDTIDIAQVPDDPIDPILPEEPVTAAIELANRPDKVDYQKTKAQVSANDDSGREDITSQTHLHQSRAIPSTKPQEIESDVTMIDLTMDDSPPKPKRVKEYLAVQSSSTETPTRGILKNVADRRTLIDQNKTSVKFLDIRQKQEPPLIGMPLAKHVSSRRTFAAPNKPIRMPSPELVDSGLDVAKRKSKVSPDMEEITVVLNQLGDAVLRRITGKFDNVRAQSNANKDRLLLNAVNDLERMHAQSIERFNLLIGLEAEYSSFGRDLKHTLDDVLKTSVSANDDLKGMLEKHDRSFLAGKVPQSLFTGGMPEHIKRVQGAAVVRR
ncbi:hypothetical protein QCA50_002654 [Cerrena zonata]|uniref:Uncharacterized protein n=1 Tax=Cerrena zonata TaxID=2478898 RepID=A0AAW0GMM2_9APHY